MNAYRITFAARGGSSSTLINSQKTIAQVTARFAQFLSTGWILTVERIS